jgi:predicted alpha/beta hydrolase family esterase
MQSPTCSLNIIPTDTDVRTSDADILFIPGLGGSGPDHWQSRWQAKLSTARRVDLGDLEAPRLDQWAKAIAASVEAATRPVILVAHSLGAAAAAHAAPLVATGRVAGALLVAPPSNDTIQRIPAIDPAFAPLPRAPLPFPSLFIASRNDPYADFDVSEELAYAWGARIADAGEAGHINAESGHGPWPEGLMTFAGFLKKL